MNHRSLTLLLACHLALVGCSGGSSESAESEPADTTSDTAGNDSESASETDTQTPAQDLTAVASQPPEQTVDSKPSRTSAEERTVPSRPVSRIAKRKKKVEEN